MSNCPICEGRLIIVASTAGEEVYCGICSSIIKSSSLRFAYDETDTGAVSECSDGGLPGYKGPGEGAKCHTYTPGDDEQKGKATQRAKQSNYMSQKRSHIEKLIRLSSGGFDTSGTPNATTDHDNADRSFGPDGSIPDMSLGTQRTKDGVLTQMPDDQNNSGLASAT